MGRVSSLHGALLVVESDDEEERTFDSALSHTSGESVSVVEKECPAWGGSRCPSWMSASPSSSSHLLPPLSPEYVPGQNLPSLSDCEVAFCPLS